MSFASRFISKIKKMFNLYSEDDFVPDYKCLDCGSETVIDIVGKNWGKNNCFCYSCGLSQFRVKPTAIGLHMAPFFRDVIFTDGSKVRVDFGDIFGSHDQSKTPQLSNYIVISDQDYNAPPPLEVIKGGKKEIESVLSVPAAEVYPDDYHECEVCGYDHKYDPSGAERKHSKVQ